MRSWALQSVPGLAAREVIKERTSRGKDPRFRRSACTGLWLVPTWMWYVRPGTVDLDGSADSSERNLHICRRMGDHLRPITVPHAVIYSGLIHLFSVWPPPGGGARSRWVILWSCRGLQ